MIELNPLNHPVCFSIPRRTTYVASWHEHIPFAMFLVDLLKPKTIVELGTHNGDSYCAFCQAVSELKLDTRCYAIDTWQGDPQAGFYGDEVLNELRAYHDPLYGSFSRLIQSTFDEALPHFDNGTIDILHIDGYHTYEAVKHDFESWFPKVKLGGIVLLHDINVRERDYGASKFWDEIKLKYPYFEFLHCHGLGVLAVDKIRSKELQSIFNAKTEEVETIRNLFFRLGREISNKDIIENKEREIQERKRDLDSKDFKINELNDILKAKGSQIEAKENQIKNLETNLVEKDKQINDLSNNLQIGNIQIKSLESLLEEKDKQINELNNNLQVKDTRVNQLQNLIQQSIVMKLQGKYQRIVEKLLNPRTKRRYYYELGLAGIRIILNEGWMSFWFKAKNRLKKESPLQLVNPYHSWIMNNEPKQEILEQQKQESHSFNYRPKISIIMPVWNTDKIWLRLAIESVIKQTYDNWELCIADGGSTKPYVKDLLNEYVKKDSRIKIKFLLENKGIAGNSNEALSLAIGEFIGLLDHDDELAPFALYEVVKLINEKPEADFIYSDEDKITNKEERVEPFFKPDWSPDMFLSIMYTCHLGIYRKKIIDEIRGFKIGYDGAQDYDLVLRFIEKTNRIYHIPKILYHWRIVSGSVALSLNSKPYAYLAAKKALGDYLIRNNIAGEVIDGFRLDSYRIRRKIMGNEIISIIIPSKDNVDILQSCINSILNKTEYKYYEIIIVDNQSTNTKILEYYDQIANNSKIKILHYDKPFNFAALNNFAVSQAKGEHILFLNNDIEIISNEWLSAMLEHSQREEVGAVGAKLMYPDGRIQHCGVIIGLGKFKNMRAAGHIYRGSKDQPGYFGRVNIINNYSAVTGACMMTKKKIFNEMGGFDEALPVAYNDIDYCFKLRRQGYIITYTPYAALYHLESHTRGDEDTPSKQARLLSDINYLHLKWGNVIDNGDPYYNPNFDLDAGNFSINTEKVGLSQTPVSRFVNNSLIESPGKKEDKISSPEIIKHNSKFTLVTYQDMVKWTLEWIETFPHDFDVIVGLPRSGLTIATIIATKLGKPLSIPDLLIKGKYWQSDMMEVPQNINKILLVDDSVASGEAILKSFELLSSKKNNFNVTTASLIVTDKAKDFVHLSYKIIPPPYNFEWCLAHQKGNGIDKIAMDLDGVICEDCPLNVDGSEELYVEWIKKVKPLFIPKYPIDIIVSNRLKKYQIFTEEWLLRNKVKYNKLYLWEINSKEERGSIEKWTDHKINVVLNEKPNLVYESDREQSERIWKATGVPVLWFTGKKIIQ